MNTYPFGKRTTVSGSYNADVGFAGYHYHAPSGLNLTLYRAYDPVQARWLSRDPIFEMGGLNLYGYVGGRPAELRDPLGLLTLPDSPSGLDPDIWERDHSHKAPNGERYRAPNGDTLDFHHGRAGQGGHQKNDHWHWNRNHPGNPDRNEHYYPGDEIPDPDTQCSDQDRSEYPNFSPVSWNRLEVAPTPTVGPVPFGVWPSPFLVLPPFPVLAPPPVLLPFPI